MKKNFLKNLVKDIVSSYDLEMLFCMSIVFSQILLTDQKIIFGVSLRIYLLSLAMMYWLFQSLCYFSSQKKGRHNSLFFVVRFKKNEVCFLLLTLLIDCVAFIWAITSENTEEIQNFFSTHIFSFFLSVILLKFISSWEKLSKLAVFIFVIAIVNTVVSAFQFFLFPWAWKLRDILTDGGSKTFGNLDSVEKHTFEGYIPGLLQYSIPSAFLSTCFGLSLLGVSAHKLFNARSIPGYILGFIFVILNLFVIIGGAFFAQSRSSMLSISVVIILLIPIMVLEKLIRIRKMIIVLLVLVISFALVSGNVFSSFAVDKTAVNPQRIADSRTESRTSLYTKSLPILSDTDGFLFGVGPSEALAIVGEPGHNLFLNSLNYYGLLFGLIPTLGLVFLNIAIIFDCIFRLLPISFVSSKNKALVVGIAMANIAYLIKSMFHNDGYVIGSYTGYILFCLLLSSHNLLSNSTKRT